MIETVSHPHSKSKALPTTLEFLIWLKKKEFSSMFLSPLFSPSSWAHLFTQLVLSKWELKRMRSFSSCRAPLFLTMVLPPHSWDCKTWQFLFTALNDLEFCFAFQFCLNPYGKVKTPNKSDKFCLVLAIPCGLVKHCKFFITNSSLFHDHLYLHLQTWMGLTIVSETPYKRAPVCSFVKCESLRDQDRK